LKERLAARLRRLCVAGGILIAAGAVLNPVTARDPGDRERAGMAIYNEGASPSGSPIHARIGAADVRLPATAVPCGGCHGRDGLGRPEGGVVPPPITWEVLTKPSGHRHADGRHHPPFSHASVAAAITDGRDPAGNRLDPSMPRYEMSAGDLDSLLAHLERLGTLNDPGVTGDTITLGLLLPGDQASGGPAVSAEIIGAYVDDLDAQGGLYGRSISIALEEGADDAAAIDAALSRLLAKPVFALIGAIPASSQPDVIRRAEAEGLPLVHLMPPEPGTEPGKHSFFLISGAQQEAQCLLAFASRVRSPAPLPVAILADRQRPFDRRLAESLSAAAEADNRATPRTVAPPASDEEAGLLVGELIEERVGVLLALDAGPGFGRLTKAGLEAGWTPDVLVPGSLAGAVIPQIPPRFTDRLLLAYPTLPSDWTPDRLRALALLREGRDVSADPLLPQVLGLAAAELMSEALRRAGRTLTRARLVEVLEQLYRFDTGLTPPLTYGPNRRIGAAGAYVMEMGGSGASAIGAAEWCEAPG
jgi:ABC-type branched-subunit amino acid transport system substrate-binding protein